MISDYTFEKDALFARINLVGDELEMYYRIHEALAEKIPVPDLMVYLRAEHRHADAAHRPARPALRAPDGAGLHRPAQPGLRQLLPQSISLPRPGSRPSRMSPRPPARPTR